MTQQDYNPIRDKIEKTLSSGLTFAPHRELEPSIEIKGVNYAYGEGENAVRVLFDNSLTIYPGEIVIMTGPSGSGKTTLLTLIGALRSLQEGSIKIFGKELYGLSPLEQAKIRRNIGFIFQAHNLFDSLTAHQNVKMSTELQKYSNEDADTISREILTKLELGEHLNKKPNKLSGGQRQRVAIGRALVNGPRLILADEPTAALDKETGRLVVSILQNMAQSENCTVLIVTHDNRILDVANRIVRMVDGYVDSDVDVAESVTIATFLIKCPVFKETSPSLLADVANKMLKEVHPERTIIIREGDEGDKFYIIRSGRVAVLKEREGKEEVLTELGPGDFFGELALLRREPRAATVRALEEVELLSLSRELFIETVEASPTLEESLKKVYFHR